MAARPTRLRDAQPARRCAGPIWLLPNCHRPFLRRERAASRSQGHAALAACRRVLPAWRAPLSELVAAALLIWLVRRTSAAFVILPVQDELEVGRLPLRELRQQCRALCADKRDRVARYILRLDLTKPAAIVPTKPWVSFPIQPARLSRQQRNATARSVKSYGWRCG